VSLVALDIIGRAGFYHDFDTFQTKERKTFNFYKVVDKWSRIFPTYQIYVKGSSVIWVDYGD
jgi:hypothetical protein